MEDNSGAVLSHTLAMHMRPHTPHTLYYVGHDITTEVSSVKEMLQGKHHMSSIWDRFLVRHVARILGGSFYTETMYEELH